VKNVLPTDKMNTIPKAHVVLIADVKIAKLWMAVCFGDKHSYE